MERPRRVLFTWHPGRAPSTAQQVELRFEAEGAGARVTLEHRGWESLGERAATTRRGYDEGWDVVFRGRFADAAARAAAGL